MAVSLLSCPSSTVGRGEIETRADDFALKLTRNPTPFIGAMERLADLNLAERKPHVLKELVLYSPSIGGSSYRAGESTRMIVELTVSGGGSDSSPKNSVNRPLALWHWTCYP